MDNTKNVLQKFPSRQSPQQSAIQLFETLNIQRSFNNNVLWAARTAL